MPFDELYRTVGFPEAYAWERAFHDAAEPAGGSGG